MWIASASILRAKAAQPVDNRSDEQVRSDMAVS